MELPAQFSERINKINSLLMKYEASVSEKEKEESLRLALVMCCEVLRSIDMEALRTSVKDVFAKADKEEPKWREIIIDGDDHFSFFLGVLEEKVFAQVGINENARNRMRHHLESARFLAKEMQPDMIVRAVKYLRDDVCLEARVKLAVDKDKADQKAKTEWYWSTSKKAVKTVAAGAIVINSFALVASLGITAPGSAVSISLGGAAQFL